jgi:lipoxygenase
MQEWPLKSELDPDVYGPPESAITSEMIEKEIKGFATIKEVPQYCFNKKYSLI